MILRGPARPEFLQSLTLPQILRATASRFPDKNALEFGKHSLSYSQFLHQAEQIAEALSFLGGGSSKIIGLWMPRSLNLWLAQAGISFSGAAWLPFDADVPTERAATCLEDSKAIACLSTREWAHRFVDFPVPVWFLEDLLLEQAPRLPCIAPSGSDRAYVIYTSGSTGTPKGISISHSNLSHLLQSENFHLQIGPEDRVYQGFSAAFDMCLEETWISFSVGATVWVAPPEISKDPEAILSVITEHKLSVLHAVPTLAALLPELPENIRLVNLGGEACPQPLVKTLTRPGRRLFNTYGPTETTVTASIAELKPERHVTIGKPLPNYGMVLLSPDQELLPAGEIGEIAIFGPGVSSGYLNQPELTAKRFIPNPYAASPIESLLYLTGDLGRISTDGEIECLGRIDNQVKLRGFRIELDEISAALARVPTIATAAAVIRPIHGLDEIVAFAVTTDPSLDELSVRHQLQEILPSYMVPAHFELLQALPVLSSGKVDLHDLRRRELSTAKPRASATEPFLPQTPGQKALWESLSELFPERTPQLADDFFEDLGGHSLLAARLVTRLRKYATLTHVGVQMIYQERLLQKIAAALDLLPVHSEASPSEALPSTPPPIHRRALCGIAQLASLPIFLFLHLLQWLAAFFVYHYFTGSAGDTISFAMIACVGTYLLVQSLSFPTSIFLRRILVGRLEPGIYPLWSTTYYRWWLGERLLGLCPVHLISGTPWMNLYLRLLGAKVGKGALINSITFSVPELLDLGENTSLGTFSNLENARVEQGQLFIGTIRLNTGACVDSYAVLEENTQLGDGAHLGGQSTLSRGKEIPAGQFWQGAPAIPGPPSNERWPVSAAPTLPTHALRLLFFAGGSAFISILFFIPTFPAFMLIDWLDAHTFDLFESDFYWWQTFPLFFALSFPSAMGLVTFTAILAGLFRQLLPKQHPGRFSIHGSRYLYKWLISTLYDTSLHVLHGLYASIYVRPWLCLMGATIGEGSEVSTAEGITPDLLQLGADCFVADGVLLGDEEQRDGWTRLQGVQIGSRTFLGNGAYVPDGAHFPNDVLLGVQSAAPSNAQLAQGQTWMGSPPLLLPARESVALPDPSLTFRPRLTRKCARGAIEAIRIVLPLAFLISAGYEIVLKTIEHAAEGNWMEGLLTLLICALTYAAAAYGLVFVLKWVCIGRYRPRMAPMWTSFVWISEAVTVLYEALAVPALLEHLKGTPFLPWTLKALGANIGRGVWINTTDFTEFDCVHLGDFAELNAHSGPQTHLFEDRIMRIGTVTIGAHSTLGIRSTVLYSASVGEHCRLGPLTLVAKGEHLPPKTSWEGTPASVPKRH